MCAQLIQKGAPVDATTKMVNGFRLDPLSLAWLTGKPILCEFLLNVKSGRWWEASFEQISTLGSERGVMVRFDSLSGPARELVNECVVLFDNHRRLAQMEKRMMTEVAESTAKEQVVKIMLDMGASPDLRRVSEDKKETMLVWAMSQPKPNPDILRHLVECRAVVDTAVAPRVLVKSLDRHGDPDIDGETRGTLFSCAQHLIKAGVHVPRDVPITTSTDTSCWTTCGFLLDRALLLAKNEMTASLLLEAGADPNGSYLYDDASALTIDVSAQGLPWYLSIFEKGCTPLRQMCQIGDLTLVKLLLEAKAAVDTPPACDPIQGWFESMGGEKASIAELAVVPTTPLSVSLLNGHDACARVLLEAIDWQVSEIGLGAITTALPQVRAASSAPSLNNDANYDACLNLVRKIAAEHDNPQLREELVRVIVASIDPLSVEISPDFPWMRLPSSAPLETEPRLLNRRVQIHDVRSRPKLNGQVGFATQLDLESGRYTVQLDGGGAAKLRPSNLTLEGAGDLSLSWHQTDQALRFSIADIRQTSPVMICLRSNQLCVRVESDNGCTYLITQQLPGRVLGGMPHFPEPTEAAKQSFEMVLTKVIPEVWPVIGPPAVVERVLHPHATSDVECEDAQGHEQEQMQEQSVSRVVEGYSSLKKAFEESLSKGCEETEVKHMIEQLFDKHVHKSADEGSSRLLISAFLQVAISKDKRGIAEKLIAHGANVNCFEAAEPGPYLSPLAFACQNGAIGCAGLLLDHKANVSPDVAVANTPMYHAAGRCDPELLRLLVKNGATRETMCQGLTRIVHFILLKMADQGGLASTGTVQCSDSLRAAWSCFDCMLRAGATTEKAASDPKWFTGAFRDALHAAYRCVKDRRRTFEQVQTVFESLDALIPPLCPVVEDIARPCLMEQLLCAASQEKEVKVVHLLLKRGAVPNGHGGKGTPALHNAVLGSKSPEIIRILLDAQANVNYFCDTTTVEGRKRASGSVHGTPLSLACWCGEPQIVQILLEAGAHTDVVRIVDRSEKMSAKEYLEIQSHRAHGSKSNPWKTCLQKLDYFEKKKARAAKAASDKEQNDEKQRARHEAEAKQRAVLEEKAAIAKRALKKAIEADELESLERVIKEHGQHVRAGSSTLKRAIAKLNLLMSTEAHTQLKAALEANTLPELRAAISKYGPTIDGNMAEKGKEKAQENALVGVKAAFVATPDLKQRLMYARKERDRLAEQQREAVKKANLEEKASKIRERQEADRKQDAEARETAAALARAKVTKELEDAHAEQIARGEAAINDRQYEKAVLRSLGPAGFAQEPAGEACSPPFAAGWQQVASPLTPSAGAFGYVPPNSENENDDSWIKQGSRKKERGGKPRTDPQLDWDDSDGTSPSSQPKSPSASAKAKHASGNTSLTLGGILAAQGLSDRLEAFKYYIECSGTPLQNILSVIQLRNIEAKLRSSPTERHDLIATVDAWYSSMAEQKRKEEAIIKEIVYGIDVISATGLQKVDIERDGNCAYACATRWYEEYGPPRLAPKEKEEIHALEEQLKVYSADYEEQHGKKPKKLTDYAPIIDQARRYQALQSREKEANTIELQMAGLLLPEGADGSELVHGGGAAVDTMRRLVSQKLSDKLRHQDEEVREAVDQEVRQMCASSAAVGTGRRGSNPTATAFLEMLDSALPSASSSLLEASSADSCHAAAVAGARDHFVAVHGRRSIFAERLQLKLMADVLKTDVHLYYYLAGDEDASPQVAGEPREIFRPGVYADGEPTVPVDGDDVGRGVRPPLRLLHLMASKHFDLLLEPPQADGQLAASSLQPADDEVCSFECSNTLLFGSSHEKKADTTSIPVSIAASPHTGSDQDGVRCCTGSDTINDYSGHSSLTGAWDSSPEQQGLGAAGNDKDLSPALPRALLPQFASKAVERQSDSWC